MWVEKSNKVVESLELLFGLNQKDLEGEETSSLAQKVDISKSPKVSQLGLASLVSSVIWRGGVRRGGGR